MADETKDQGEEVAGGAKSQGQEPGSKKDDGLTARVKDLEDRLERTTSRLSEVNSESAQRRRELQQYKELGIAPDEIAEILSERKAAETRKAEERGEWEKLRTQLNDTHHTELEQRDQRITALQKQLDDNLIDGALLRAADKLGAYAHLLPDYARRFIRMEDRDGKRVPVVVDEKGDRRINGEGDYMSIDGLVTWMKEQEAYWPLFRGEPVAGGGAGGHEGAGRAVASSKKITDMTDAEKMDWIEEHGLEAWQQKVLADYK